MDLRFEGVIGYSTADAEEAAHFFEHTLGLEASGTEGALRFYALGDGLTVSVDASGAAAGEMVGCMRSGAAKLGFDIHLGLFTLS